MFLQAVLTTSKRSLPRHNGITKLRDFFNPGIPPPGKETITHPGVLRATGPHDFMVE